MKADSFHGTIFSKLPPRTSTFRSGCPFPIEQVIRTEDAGLIWRVNKVYASGTCYVVGEAKSPGNNPITKKYDGFFIGFVIDPETDLIVDVECTAMMGITVKFVQSLFAGRSILDYDGAAKEVQARYFGSSQKALIVAFKQAYYKYKEALNK